MSLAFKTFILVAFSFNALASDWTYYSGEEEWYQYQDQKFKRLDAFPKMMKRKVFFCS